MAVGIFFLCSPACPKQLRTSFLFYKFSYTFICAKICAYDVAKIIEELLKLLRKLCLSLPTGDDWTLVNRVPKYYTFVFSFLLLPFHSAILDWKYFPFFQLEYCFVIEIHFFLFLIGISSYYSIWKFCMLIGIFPFHYSNTSLFRICAIRLKFEWL